MDIRMRKIVKEGLGIFLLYAFITLCLLLATDRIERLDHLEGNFRNRNSSVSLNLGK